MSGVAGAAPGRLDRRLGRAGAVLLGLLVLVAALAPVLAPYDPTAFVGAPYTPPGPDHPLGTNDVGQDLLSELIYGARVSLLFGLVAAIVGTGVGLLVGTAAGFLRGRTDAVLMRIVDIVLVIPFLPLLLILAAFFGGGVVTELIVISAVIWARPSREIRSQALSVRERGHVQAALAMGASGSWILARHVLPAVISLVPPQLVRAAKGAILLEASLSFLGLGDPTVRSWGTMLYYANARGAFLGDSWLWWVVPPGVALGVVVLGFAFVGYALESWGRPALSTGSAGMADRAEDEPATGEPPESRAPASDDAILAVRDLSVSYGAGDGRVRAVRSVDLDVARGEVVGIVGESGSGKTSLIRAILGLVPPPGRIEGGEIAFLGRDLRVLGRDELRDLRGDRLALIPQAAQNALDPLIAVADQVAEAIVAHRDTDWPEARRRAADLLAAVGIPADRHAAFPHQFSGGMRQRVLIAMALANDPALLLADEPTTGLDSLTRVQLLDLFAEIRERSGLSILLVSHDLPVVLGAADRVAVMVEGSIVEEGTPRELTERPRHPYTKRLLAAAHLRDDAGSGDDAGPDGAGPDDDAGPGDDGHAAPALRLENVSRRFTSRRGDVLAVDGVDLEVGRGEIVGLVGRSGAGKSTLARLIVGLERPDGGLIELPGGGLIDADATGPARLPRHTLRLRQIVFQDPYSSMPPHLRVDSIVAEPLRIYGERGGEDLAAREALDTVGLRPVERFLDRYPHELSGGELQRVALARAVIARPELIVADEPASLLDAPLRAGVVAQLASIRARLGTSILYITHDIGLAVSLCDRLVVLAEGRVVDAGSIGELHAGTRHPETERLVEAWRSLTLPRSTDRAGD